MVRFNRTIMTEYNSKTKIELIALCKEKGVKGYAQIGITKEKIIQLLTGEIEYKDPREKENWSEKKKDSFEKTLTTRRFKNNLFDYLTKNNPSIISKYDGDIDDMKVISHSTMEHSTWKCENYSECSNTFDARPRDVFRNDSKSATKYCKDCKHIERGKCFQQNMLSKNGSILDTYPNIVNVWSESNKYKPTELTSKSHKTVTLKCVRNPSHPEYNIRVYNIQDTNCVSCPKCATFTSKAEIRLYSELLLIFQNVTWQKKIQGREADITIEDIKLVIEVDGYPWHRDKTEKDKNKNVIFNENGYDILRVRDPKLPIIEGNTIICDVSNFTTADLNKIIEWINKKYNYNIGYSDTFNNVSVYNSLISGLLHTKYENSIEYLFPESVNIWDYEKNAPFSPSQFTAGSHTEAWIKCKSGHSFKRQIKLVFRIIKSNKKIIQCPECTNKLSFKNKRSVCVNGITYKSITDCCTKLNISRTKLYTNIRTNNIDITDTTNIVPIIITLLNKKET